MMARDDSASGPGHPAPHGERVGLGALTFGVIGAPAAWIVQLTVSYGFSSYACFPARMPLAEAIPSWDWMLPVVVAVNVCALLVALAAAVVSWRSWQATREEVPGGRGSLLETGEGRTRFLSGWGVMFAGGFLLAIIFNIIGLIVVPPCAS